MSSLRNNYYGITVGKTSNRYTIGNAPGVTNILMRGLLLSASLNTPQTVWNQGGDYVYLTQDTPLYLSSSSASDTDVDILFSGLTEDGNRVSIVTTLTGQTQVLVGSAYRTFDITSIRGDLVGEVYLAESDTVIAGVPQTASKIKAKISLLSTAGEVGELASDHSSHNGIYTVPAGFNFHLFEVLGSSDGQEGSLTYRVKLPGFPWWNRNPLSITNNRIDEVFDPALILPPGTELQARALGGNGKRISTRAQGWLVPIDV